jgi:hypothetical protein
MRLNCENHAGRCPKVPGKVCTMVPEVVPGAASGIAYRKCAAAAPVVLERQFRTRRDAIKVAPGQVARTPVTVSGLDRGCTESEHRARLTVACFAHIAAGRPYPHSPCRLRAALSWTRYPTLKCTDRSGMDGGPLLRRAACSAGGILVASPALPGPPLPGFGSPCAAGHRLEAAGDPQRGGTGPGPGGSVAAGLRRTPRRASGQLLPRPRVGQSRPAGQSRPSDAGTNSVAA